MRSSGWWWRLQYARWLDGFRQQPLRRGLVWALWLGAFVLTPLLGGSDAVRAGATLKQLLSFDVPLTLALAAGVFVDALAVRARAGAEDWLWHRDHRPAAVRRLARLRWLLVLRWPVGLWLAIAWLAGRSAPMPQLAELLVMPALALIVGLVFIWALRSSVAVGNPPADTRPRRVQGLAALAWAPLHETRAQLHPRFVVRLAIPVLLAAPAGAMVDQVLGMLVLVFPLFLVALLAQQAGQVSRGTARWLDAGVRLRWRIFWSSWRYVLLLISAIFATYMLWPASSPRGQVPSQ